MLHLDLQVVEQALKWQQEGRSVWLCTVLSTFGSSPRAPGAMMATCDSGLHIGSLSGGCVEEDFLDRLQKGEFSESIQQIHYGMADDNERSQVILPCGGQLNVLVEYLPSNEDNIQYIEQLLTILMGQTPNIRIIDLDSQTRRFMKDNGKGLAVELDESMNCIRIRVGPTARLIIVGNSSVTPFCAQYAQMMGFQVVVCDHRENAFLGWNVPLVQLESVFPASYISDTNHIHFNTAIVALTHDPRIDDVSMIDAVKTSAFYLGVMGSVRTSHKRAERLKRIGGLNDEEINRIVMPIGLNLGSKAPAEIALAIMADILRVQNGVSKDAV
ncbi:hypothetical protein MUS1_00375 [Marinomonas ushuaiensis DSM 15871]|uniref:Xanthine dehydrogenase n=1 Tax=Marinomonas ushuaiensis DSM 15871 TaxID=1122207 RepID=X7E8B6_9GAMM|nr:XdhC family protein [Marinomonas ushuaiensis]ETX12100.1 hypothetical protein MUS1_00375 [Marinomonas ushuaiensis DSM 15871]